METSPKLIMFCRGSFGNGGKFSSLPGLSRETQHSHSVHGVTGVDDPLAVALVLDRQPPLLLDPRLPLPVHVHRRPLRLRLQRLASLSLSLEHRHHHTFIFFKFFQALARPRRKRLVILAQVLHRERVGGAAELLQVGVSRADALVEGEGEVGGELDARLDVAAELVGEVLEFGSQGVFDAQREQLAEASHRVNDVGLVHADGLEKH
mmetsp:Transcript_41172/g.101535  ORF Transcript_41172/g.101535 Transcript_41172/m.101535 type:complete len:207 (-) Transcript_41172:743-1363(-)